MKKLLITFLIIFAVSAGAQTNIIYFKVGDILSGAGSPNLRNLKTVLTDTTVNPRVINDVLISPAPKTAVSQSDGKVYFTNVVWGTYNITLYGTPQVMFDIQVQTNTTGLVDGASLMSITNVPNPLSEFYTKVQIDALFSSFNPGVDLNTLLATSNALQSQITSGGVSAVVATNIAVYVSNNSSNAVFLNAQAAINTASNSIVATGQASVNSASNLWNSGSNNLQTAITANAAYAVSVSNLWNSGSNNLNTAIGSVQTYSTSVSNQWYSGSNNLAGLLSAAIAVVTNGSPTAVIQAQIDAMTNSVGVVSFQPGSYTLTNTIYIRGSLILDGNQSTFHWPAGNTNAMFDTGTNYHQRLLVQNCIFDGGTYLPFNATNYFHVQHRLAGFEDANPYFNPYFTNRTAFRVEVSGGAVFRNNHFFGWSGSGLIAMSIKTTTQYTYPSLIFVNNYVYTNFNGVLLATTAEDTQGFYNNDITGQGAWSAEYALIANNFIFANQNGVLCSPGNVAVSGNFIDRNWIGLLSTSSYLNNTHGRYDHNTMNHNQYALWFFNCVGGEFSDNVFLRNGQDIGPNGTNIVLTYGSNGGFHFDSVQRVDFHNNQFSREPCTFTNGTFGSFYHNTYGALNVGTTDTLVHDTNIVWGDAANGVYTNFDSGMQVFGNRETQGWLHDGSMASILAKATNAPFAGAVASTDGTNGYWSAAAGGSGFPLSGDADAGGFSLTNAANLKATNQLNVGGSALVGGLITTNGMTNLLLKAAAAHTNVVIVDSNGNFGTNDINNFATGSILGTTNLAANQYASFDANTNVTATRNGNNWTNLVAWTHEGTTTNITATFNGTLQTFTCTNGPSAGTNYFFHYAGANGSVSYRFASFAGSYNVLTFDYPPKWLAGSNNVITNGVLSLTSYGGTNASQLEAAIKENQ